MFYSEKFSFNGIDSDEMDVILVTSSKTDILNDYSYSFVENIKKDNIKRSDVFYTSDGFETEEMELEFAYVNSAYEPQIWDEDKLREVIDWLYTDSFCPFISEDNDEIIYYLKATKITKYFNHEMKGMLKITFLPYSPYVYKKFQKTVNVEDVLTIKIDNDSNIHEDFYAPIFEIIQKGEGDIEVKNLSMDKDALVIQNLNSDDMIIIDNGNYVVQDKNKSNKFKDVNRKWVLLKKGRNVLEIKGNCTFTIKCNYPYLI